MLSDLPSRVIHQPKRFAVLLNARAKRWTGELHQAVSRWVPARDLFLTDDFRQAERTVDRVLASGDYDVIFTGGGDGTIVYLLSALEERIRRGDLAREDAPPVGVLRLGTGNAIATYLNCRDAVDDLRAISGGSPIVVYDVEMIEAGDGLYPFVGFGWDALVLNDYDSFKESVRETALENYATGLGGYAASILTRSIPTAIGQRHQEIRITNTGDHAVSLDERGEPVDELEEGAILYEGPAQVLGGSTIPYWGFQIRMFPFCTTIPGHYQLRVYDGPMGSILTHLPSFWRGKFHGGRISDFMVKGVRIEIQDGAMPYHVAGDPSGWERDVTWTIARHPAQLAVPLR